jgi:hypothetical protein
MRRPPEGGAHLNAAAQLPQLAVHRAHQVGRDLRGDVLSGHHHGMTTLLEGAEQIRPEIHQLGLAPRPQPLAFEMGSASLPVPQGGSGGAAVAPLGQAPPQRFRGGSSIEVKQTSGLQHLVNVLGGDAVHTADLLRGQPLGD